MNHTDFYTLHRELDERAKQELIAAVRAHGGEYVFAEPDEYEEFDAEDLYKCPVIMAATRWMEGYEDFYIVRVEFLEKEGLCIYGVPKERWDEELELDSFVHGHLEYIIDEIPETEEVKSVAISKNKSTPILEFSLEDVECLGYDSDMTVEQVNELEKLLQKTFEGSMDVYWDTLRQACEKLGLSQLNTMEENG